MSIQVAAAAGESRGPKSLIQPLVKLLVRRRVAVTLVLLAALLLVDGLVFHGRPRNVTDWSQPLVAGGILTIFFGLLIRAWAAGTLRKQKQLATTGPYAWVRHPLYLGSFLMMGGFAALAFHPFSLLIFAVPLVWMYWHTIRSEEKQMAKLFPLEWPEYAARVPALLPYRPVRPQFADWSLAQWLRNSEQQAWIGSAAALVGLKLWQILV